MSRRGVSDGTSSGRIRHTRNNLRPHLLEYIHLAVTLILTLDQVLQCDKHVKTITSPAAFVAHGDDVPPVDNLPAQTPNAMISLSVHIQVQVGSLITRRVEHGCHSDSQLHINAFELGVSRVVQAFSVRKGSECRLQPMHPILLVRVSTRLPK